MAHVSGADILARTLREHGIMEVFELPGDPIGTILNSCTGEGIRCFTFRHEQAAAMAAQAWSWTTRTPGVAIVASGPAMVNAITGLYTAWANCWPFVLIGGNSISTLRGMGDFQETPQVEAAAPFTKWSVSVSGPERIPFYVSRAIHRAMEGRPGPVYLDLPADVITGTVDEEAVETLPVSRQLPPARPLADPGLVEQALVEIERAERPLLIIGKGAAWSDAAADTRRLVDRLGIPFVPSPTGKGVVPDDHRLCVAAARSYALSHADLILVLGARLNWIFHFGRPPRFAPGVKVIQIDIDPEEIGNNLPATVGLVGDATMVVRQMLDAVGERTLQVGEWREALQEQRRANEESVAPQIASDQTPMNFYRLFREIADVLDEDAYVVADGESTAAISRAMLPNFLPRHRLDAGVSGCMGVGVPYAIGVQVAHPDKQVLCITGDFALGWNLTDVETAVRYDLPIVFVVANNRSIGVRGGRSRYMQELRSEAEDCIRYDRIIEAFGGWGAYVESPDALRPALEQAFAARKPALLNVVVDPGAARKEQPFPWLARLGRMQY